MKRSVESYQEKVVTEHPAATLCSTPPACEAQIYTSHPQFLAPEFLLHLENPLTKNGVSTLGSYACALKTEKGQAGSLLGSE